MVHIVKQGSRANNSLWTSSTSGSTFHSRDLPTSIDVAIIGGGFSGLWSAFHLKKINPALSIAIFEAKEIGFGASGRNGGWASSDYPVYKSTLIKRHGRVQAELLFASLRDSIDEIGDFAREHAPNTGYVKSGTLSFARNRGQLRRLESIVDSEHQFLSAAEVSERIAIEGVRGGIFNPHCATVQPYELVLGLARYLTSQGVAIYSHSYASRFDGGVLVNNHVVRAGAVIQATEVFGAPGRDFIPLYSLMVATEPLSDQLWHELGNYPRFTFAEASHQINYAQRTVDGRLAVGGRGATYPFGSKLIESKESTESVHERLRNMTRSWFPQLKDIRFTHAWGGAVAITRDWEPYLIWDRAQSFGKIGGYAGDGVTMSHLAAKALAAEITDSTHSVRGLHFINRPIRSWEPEPLRYVAVNSLVKLSSVADKEESLTGRPSLLNRIIAPVILR